MPHLHLRLLGGFDVRVAGQSAAPLAVKKAQALLAYLALHPGQHQPREKLAALLWGEMAEEYARTNLRQSLAELRKALAHKQRPCVINAGSALYLDAGQAEIDVVQFEQGCDQATPAALEEAVALYRGEFLDGFSLSEEAFENWLMSARRRLHERQLQALNILLKHYLDTTRNDRSIDTAIKLLALDPLQEPIHRILMQCYHAEGRRHAVLQQYENCREILLRELGIKPAAETVRLYRRLLGQPPVPGANSQPQEESISITMPADEATAGQTTTELPLATATAPFESSQSQRRQLTVMMLELVGASALAERCDPEELEQIIRAFQQCCTAIVNRYEGHVANSMSDGMLVYFGYPRAHEDDAERALHAGLEIIDAVRSLELHKTPRLQTRIGVATGLVVVGETFSTGGNKEQAAVGETPNLAAALKNLAAPGSLLTGANTQRLVGGVFMLKALGAQTLDGFSKPVPAWRVTGARAVESRFEAHARILVPLVGRESELGLLLERWGQVKAGEGQVVLLSGEAGIGKSRILRAVRDTLSGEPHYRISYQCSPYHTDSALYPAIQQLTRAAGFAAGDQDETKLDKLEAVLALALADPAGSAPLIAALLGIGSERRYGKLELSPQQQRAQTLQALIEQLTGLAQHQPVLFAIEDVHWIDPTTLELIELSLDAIAQAQVLLVMTARPAFEHHFGGHPIVTRLALNRLGRQPVLSIIDRLAGGKALPQALIDQIIRKTDGVPLFVEELTKTALESGQLRETETAYLLERPVTNLDIPSSLHDSLMARLDRLRPIREVAQTAACIGREFSYNLLAAIAQLDDQKLQAALEQLVEAGLVFRRGVSPDIGYAFKHALVRDTAYESLLKSKRRQWHQRIAYVLAERFAEIADSEPELLAYHYSQAGLRDKAIANWYKAGQLAIKRSAYVEALAHLDTGLQLLEGLPDSREHAEQALRMQIARATTLNATRGYLAPATIDAYERARRLCQTLDDPPAVFSVLRGICNYHHLKGDIPAALKVGQECLHLAQNQDDTAPQSLGHRLVGMILWHRGQFGDARKHLEQALACYDLQRHSTSALAYGLDLKTSALNYLALALCLLGYPDQAMTAAQAALNHARQLGYAFNLTSAMNMFRLLPQTQRKYRTALEVAERQLALSDEHGIEAFANVASIQHDWARVMLGETDIETVSSRFQEWLGEMRSQRAMLFVPVVLGYLTEALIATGQADKARGMIDEALVIVEQTEHHWYEAELQRLKGEILQLQHGPSAIEKSEVCFQQALVIARRQGAKWWELRTATRLARLWLDQGKHQKAYNLLAPIYDWFTEGFDTADLKDAKAVLRELS